METEEVSCPEVGSSEDVCLSNPQLPTDLLENQNEQLRGDAIGNTLYSERFVLKTLIKLSQVKEEDWCEDFENDLCYLWDMTVEADVVSLLMNHDFLTLATSLLKGPLRKHRFIEIIVGILRNMCCNENVRQKLSHKSETTKLLMKLLLSPDALTLIQLVRLLNSVAWDLVKEVDQRNCKKQHWLEKQMDRRRFCNRLTFILNSSTNEDLLCGVLDVLNTLCTYGLTLNDKDFSQYFATPKMVGSLIECWHQLFVVPSLTTTIGDTEYTVENLVGSSDNELFLDKHMFRTAKKWVAVVASFTGHENGRTAVVACGGHVSKIMCRLLSTSDEDERCEEMMTDAVNILEALIPTHFVPHILRRMLILYDRVTQSQTEQMDEDGEGSSLPVETLMLIETLENYFESVLRNTKKPLLLEALDRCDNHMVSLFWSTVHKRCMELASDWNTNEDDERTI